ncbi:MAG: DNA methyltransferase [Patescibacteria group bacterium]
MKLSFANVQRNIVDLANREHYTKDVLFELMAAYGRSASSITKLRRGAINLSEDKNNTFLQRGVVYFKYIDSYKSLPAEVDKIEKDPLTIRYNPRFVIITDLKKFAAKDLKKGNSLETEWKDIDRHVDFFFGWTGDEVTDEKTEALADRRAADKMHELYQEVEQVNKIQLSNNKSNFRHNLNVFFSRLLFCFFAEDTKVFSKDSTSIFTSAIKDFTLIDGSDLDTFLETLFQALDEKDVSKFTSPFSNFPYVNGKLFDKNFGVVIPKFNAQARKLIIDCGSLNWAEINPDIFGSMFQSIVDEEMRSTHGMHYTSVPNIMKTIEPLFLDELRADFDKNYDNKSKLKKLYDRISKIKIFDPACGSGNFLIIAYKELRKLEHAIIDRLFDEDYEREILAGRLTSRIDLNNFFGIEIDDFACEVATLSLYLAKHQMNIEFEKQFGKRIELIPLTDRANIAHGNAARIDWQAVCPNLPQSAVFFSGKQEMLIPNDSEQMQLAIGENQWEEIYLIGNPPYGGSRKQTSEQKEDLRIVFSEKISRYKSLDYVAAWFFKAVEWLGNSNKAAFSLVSTNSVTQGLQLELLWPLILNNNISIDYAYTSFIWKNSASKNAGVTCVIIAVSKRNKKTKYIYENGLRFIAENISPYLTNSRRTTTVSSRNQPLSNIPEMNFGNMPADGGMFILSTTEKNHLSSTYPLAQKFLFKLIGSKELLQDTQARWCLWLTNASAEEIRQIPFIQNRINEIREIRLKSSRPKLSNTPHLFAQITADPNSYKSALILPRVCSNRYMYIPVRFASSNEVISDACQVIPNPPTYIFSIISSKMHLAWLNSVGGKLKTDYRYSKDIVYNNFPLKSLTDNEMSKLQSSTKEILFIRQNHSEKILADLYDPDKMPDDLREAHHRNDILVDSLYRQKPYESEEERLSDLFKLYEEMTKEENNE